MGKLRTALALGVALLSAPALAQTGPPIPISQLPPAGALTGTELFYVVQGNVSKNVTFSSFLASMQAGLPISLVVPGGTGIYTTDGSYFLIQNTSATAQSIYRISIPLPYVFYDIYRGTLVLNPGTTVQNADVYGAYVLNKTVQGTAPNQANAVGFFAATVAGIAGSATWGGNFAWYDGGFVSTGVGLENDFNITATGDIAVGFSANLQGNGTGTVEGFGCNSSQATSIRWSTCFLTADGGAATGITIGAMAAGGPNSPSQSINMRSSNASSVIYTGGINFIDDAFGFSDSEEACAMGLFLGSTTVTVGTITCASGQLVLQGTGGLAVVANSPLIAVNTVSLTDAAIFVAPSNCGSLASSTKCLAIIDPNGNTMYAPLYGTY